MAFWNKKADPTEQGYAAGQQILEESGETVDTLSWSMVVKIADANKIDPDAFAFGVRAALTGETYCTECRFYHNPTEICVM